MQYRKNKNGEDVSILGYGCMRFTKNMGRIDIPKAERELLFAIKHGVNYFDTAYIYGGSEAALGEILERNHCREKIMIATKLPQYLVKSRAQAEKILKEELRRLRTTYVDNYLMHMLSDTDNWNRLKSIGIDKWLESLKKKGIIKNIGFSFHGSTEQFISLIDAYDWDFCQIQYNYLDENTQAGKKGLKYAAKKGIPVIIMEPLRGGRLVNLLPKRAKAAVKKDSKQRSAAELAFRWLWNQPEVTCVLSGMNSMSMVKENIKAARTAKAGEFTQEDFDLISELRRSITEDVRIGCTGCGYCQPCPKGVNIPQAFQCYNMTALEGRKHAFMDYFQTTTLRALPCNASLCVGCGKCEQHCPQHLPIRKHLKEVVKEFETPVYKAGRWFVKTFKFY